MSNVRNAFQAAIYTRLTGYSPLTTALGGEKVYDFVPEAATPPYVVIGNNTVTDWDTKSKRGWVCTLTLHAWSFETAGQKQVNSILGHIDDALHQQEANIIVAGFSLVQIRFDDFMDAFQETAVEGAGDRYWHGVARYRATVHA